MSQEFIDFVKKRFTDEAPEIDLIDIHETHDRVRLGTFYLIRINFDGVEKHATLFVSDVVDMTKSVNVDMYSQAIIIEAGRTEKSDD